jgi:hypothetical protein
MATRARGWVFTLNNYTDEEITTIIKINGYRYLTFGKEVGENQTKHLQGYIHYHSVKSFNQVKNDLLRSHIEQRRGSLEQAITYCHKDGDFYEFGERPLTKSEQGQKGGEAYKLKWKRLVELAESGNLDEIKEIAPAEYVLHFTKFKSLRNYSSTIIDGSLNHEWWYGPTGTGKSRTVWELFPNHYQKELNKWWCGYNGEDVVVIEEWCPKNECTGSHLKIWADRYPFTAQIKGGSLQKIRPKKIIVLSNYTIDQCFTNPEDLLPLKRRFTIKHFTEFATA